MTAASGTAATYDIRYSTSTINEGNWASATQASGEPAPRVAGTGESLTVPGLSRQYHLLLRHQDGRRGAQLVRHLQLSQRHDLASPPPPDTTAPAAVTNLATTSPTQTASP